MNYNQLKVPILQILSSGKWVDSNALAKELSASKGVSVDIHALRMALMRYYRQGLLRRERREGVYVYLLTERGAQRLKWLETQRR